MAGDNITLREYTDAYHDSHEKQHELHEKEHERDHVATEQAITVAVASLDKRLDGMNEFRQALTEQQATFVRRDMLDQYRTEQDRKHDEQGRQIITLQTEFAAAQGRILGIAAALSFGAVVLSLVLRFIPT